MDHKRDAIVLCCGDGQHRIRIEARLVKERLSPAYCDFISAPALFKIAAEGDTLGLANVLDWILTYRRLHTHKDPTIYLVCDSPCGRYGNENTPNANAEQLAEAERLARAITGSVEVRNVPTKVLATWL